MRPPLQQTECAYYFPTAYNLSHRRQLPWVATIVVEPPVGFLVIAEIPFLRVPYQLAAVPIGKITEVAHGDAAGADFDIRHGALSLADTIDPITVNRKDALRRRRAAL